MARPPKPATTAAEPKDWSPTQPVPSPVLNRPFEEPAKHWRYADGKPTEIHTRRPASYYYVTKKVGSKQEVLFADEKEDRLELVNRLRNDVRAWRESDYKGASNVTKTLLRHWFHAERPRRVFFCQREAVETVIYLLELGIPNQLGKTGRRKFEVDGGTIQRLLAGERPDFLDADATAWPRLVDPAPEHVLPLRRLGCRMATGSGKTLVMAMLITWAFCNRAMNGASRHFPNGILVCAPNVTVRKRLQVLRPGEPGNYYDQFDLVPRAYRDLLGMGRVLITNWHAFAPKSEHREGDSTFAVVQKGEETPEAFTRDRLQELVHRLPILVLNDEAHHCWRPNPGTEADLKDLTAEEKAALAEDAEEARVWLAGLDRINNSGLAGKDAPGILATIDLSATPFYLANSGHIEGSPFPWLVSDFGLVDAIECGIVKVPRMPVEDDQGGKDDAGRPDPKFFRLWRHMVQRMTPADKLAGKRWKPEALYREAAAALTTLASNWRLQFQKMEQAQSDIPPVLIVVCDNTELSQVVYEAISGERIREVVTEGGKTKLETTYGQSQIFPELANTETARHTIRIDSKLLGKLETGEGQTRDEAAQALRTLIDTVGKRGMPGEQVRCVVSVSMLTEGWDANNVTHILGIRAFGTQLLCEQVVGRALRRMRYEVNPEGFMEAEYADIYGIPFSLIPYQRIPKEKSDNTPEYRRIFSVPGREGYRIQMPVVESYTYDIRSSGIQCKVDQIPVLHVDAEPTEVFLAITRGYEDEGQRVQPAELIKQTRAEFYAATRPQQVLFKIAQDITDDLVNGVREGVKTEILREALYARHLVFPEVFRILGEYVAKRVKFGHNTDERELALPRYATLVRERVRTGILPAAARTDSPLLPVLNSAFPVLGTDEIDDSTTRPIVQLFKSELNAAAVLSEGKTGSIGEARAIEVLEDLDFVEAIAPNHRKIGFQIPWEYLGNARRYEPDFLVRLRGGTIVVLEIKGGKGELYGAANDEVEAKNAAALKWVHAVNNTRTLGRWAYEICRDLHMLREQLVRHTPDLRGRTPFRVVDGNPPEQFKSCVPLMSLSGAVRRWQKPELMALWGDPNLQWVTWSEAPQFEKGMFVAPLGGGAYGIFRSCPDKPEEGKPYLLFNAGMSDPQTGAPFTVRTFSCEVRESGEGQIVLRSLQEGQEPMVLPGAAVVRSVASFVDAIR